MKKKGKLLVIALLLVAVCGLAGGVYSYYWAQGSFRTFNDDIDSDNKGSSGILTTDKSFYPYYSTDVSSGFVGGSETHSIELECDNNTNENIDCEGTIFFRNDGNDSIDFSYSDFTLACEDSSVNLSSITPTFKWVQDDSVYTNSSIRLDPSDSANLVINFSIPAGGSSTVGEQVTEPIDSIDADISMNIKITATQVHGE